MRTQFAFSAIAALLFTAGPAALAYDGGSYDAGGYSSIGYSSGNCDSGGDSSRWRTLHHPRAMVARFS